MVKLKYTGQLGYLEARYRLGLGDKRVLLDKINELKNPKDLVETAKELFNE